MSSFEIISRLCEVTETLSEIVKRQQTLIEQYKIEEAFKEELRNRIRDADQELDALEYGMRGLCDRDDVEVLENYTRLTRSRRN